MDRVVQQNAAAAEESAAASEELNVQAAQMKNMVDDLVILVEGLNGDKSRGPKDNPLESKGRISPPRLIKERSTIRVKTVGKKVRSLAGKLDSRTWKQLSLEKETF